MLHLYTLPRAEGVEIAWMVDNPDPERPKFSQIYTQIAMGLAFEPSPFACVVGLKHRPSRTGQPPSRWYHVIDECATELLANIWPELVRLKDVYRIRGLHGPDRPAELAEALRRMEGLAYYRPETKLRAPQTLRERWPSYVDPELTCSINLRSPPDADAVLKDLESWLHDDVMHPDSELPIIGKDLQPVPKLALPGDLPTRELQAGLRQAMDSPCQALWYAVSGLERTPIRDPQRKMNPQRHGNRITGY